MLRQAIADGTPLGRQAAPIMERGQLVPDELLIGLIRERISRADCENGYILDGFPRTLPQAEGLEAMAGVAGLVVFDIDVPRETLLRRLSGRRWCPKCQSTYHVETSPPTRPGLCDWCSTPLVQREDDKEAVVRERLAHYRSRPGFHHIDGNRPVEVVFAELLEKLGAQA
jgi:adenylate kinase